jgi:hypothetical protein
VDSTESKNISKILEEKLDEISSILDEIREAIVNLTTAIADKPK